MICCKIINKKLLATFSLVGSDAVVSLSRLNSNSFGGNVLGEMFFGMGDGRG